jgi:uncharacterized protein
MGRVQPAENGRVTEPNSYTLQSRQFLMKWQRIALVAFLALAPFLFLITVGTYHLWATGWGFIAWWPMAASLALAYFLGWLWTRKGNLRLLPNTNIPEPPTTWTARDQQAWAIVEKKAAAITTITTAEMVDTQRYADTAISLALEIAQVYHPGSTDPFGHLTLPEILTCAELVAHDLHTKVSDHLPGSHLLTINQWKQTKQAVDWGKTAWNVSWVARAVMNPLKAGIQYVASKASGSILNRVQENVMLWFYTAFIHELGQHLIELNSGRLKVGAKRYREIMHEAERPPATSVVVNSVSVAIVGQVKAGKSSLVNALLGEQRAATDVVPTTTGATKYELKLPDQTPVTIVDTAGYGVNGPTEAEVTAAVEAAQQAELILLVLHARTAARKADVEMLAKIEAAFALNPQLRFPPVIAVLSHIDLLSPAMEWQPPYLWEKGCRTKEVQIREAIAMAAESLDDRTKTFVPVCTAAGKNWNVEDTLTELMAATMDDAHGTALLKLLHKESRSGRAQKTLDQVLTGGRAALKILWESVKK